MTRDTAISISNSAGSMLVILAESLALQSHGESTANILQTDGKCLNDPVNGNLYALWKRAKDLRTKIADFCIDKRPA
jgi:hypothetical protein